VWLWAYNGVEQELATSRKSHTVKDEIEVSHMGFIFN
jgi:hypothetical protein